MEAILTATQGIESRVQSLHREVRGLVDSTARPEPAVDAPAVVKSALRRSAPVAAWIVGAGLALDAAGADGTLALMAYVLGALAVPTGHAALRWVNRDRDLPEREHVVDLFFVSLFFTLTAPCLIGALTKADHFGFYTVEAFTNTPMPFLLAMLVDLELALVASVLFSLSWRRHRGANAERGLLSRAVWITLPPLLFPVVNLALFGNLGVWMYVLVVFGVLFGAFATIVALDESGSASGETGRVLKAAAWATVLFGLFGLAGAVATFLEPGPSLASAEFRVVPLPEVTAEELGYTPDEGVELMRLGLMWQALAVSLYLAAIVGGYLLLTMRRAAAGRASRPSA